MRKLLFAVVLLLSLHVAAFAQATTQVSGVVTDPTGAVIPNTKIEIENLDTGLKRDPPPPILPERIRFSR